MNKDLDQQLCEQFPLLYRDREGPLNKTCMHWGLSVGNGWYSIIRDLSAKLEPLIAQFIEQNPRRCENCGLLESEHLRVPRHPLLGMVDLGEEPPPGEADRTPICRNFLLSHPRAAQVKEKFGGLRFYMEGPVTAEMAQHISAAEALSLETCEVCGKPGTQAEGYWIKIKCDDCKASNARPQ